MNNPDENEQSEDSDSPSQRQGKNELETSLLRFVSKDLELKALVASENDCLQVQLVKDGELVGTRRLAKDKCCRSNPPCMGTIPIAAQFQLKYNLPSFVHVSFCFEQIKKCFEKQNQRYPRTC